MQCYRQPEHQNPSHARFCVTCGIPLRQPCPHDSGHWIRVVEENGRAARSCPECHRLLRPCKECHRLHRLAEETCRTAGCRTPLPPVRSDWPHAGGGPERAGSSWLPRAVQPIQDGGRVWEAKVGGTRGPAISAFGNLYLAVGPTVRLVDPTRQETQWLQCSLPSAVQGSPAALAAEGGLIMVLTQSGAISLAPENLSRTAAHPGRFEWQTPLAGDWLFYGVPEGEAEPVLQRVPLALPSEPPRRLPVSEPLRRGVLPVACGTTLYLAGTGGRLLRSAEGAFLPEYLLGGEIVEMAATPEEQEPTGVALLTRGADHTYGLHLLYPQEPSRVEQIRLEGARVLPRLWMLGPYVFVARNAGASGERAQMLRYDRRMPGMAPETLTWASGLELVDAFLLSTPAGVVVEMALKDPTSNSVQFTRQSWEVQSPTLLSRAIGAEHVGLLPHGDESVAVFDSTVTGQVVARGHRL